MIHTAIEHACEAISLRRGSLPDTVGCLRSKKECIDKKKQKKPDLFGGVGGAGKVCFDEVFSEGSCVDECPEWSAPVQGRWLLSVCFTLSTASSQSAAANPIAVTAASYAYLRRLSL